MYVFLYSVGVTYKEGRGSETIPDILITYCNKKYIEL